jgi:hypothetical protein
MPLPPLHEFDCLSLGEQVSLTIREAQFLAGREDTRGDRIFLYHGGSYFVEVYYCPHLDFLHHCRPFSHGGPLEEYVAHVEIPMMV